MASTQSSNQNEQEFEQSIGSDPAHQDQASRLAELGACASLFAHEVNNLMTQVGGRAQLALMCPDQPELTQRALELSLKASLQIEHLASNMMKLHEDDHDGLRSIDSGFGIGIDQIHEQTTAFLDPHDVGSFGFELINDQRVHSIKLPGALVQQVLLNLYLNSVRALRESSPPTDDQCGYGSVRLRIMTHEQCSTGNIPIDQDEIDRMDYMMIVEDSGDGIDPDLVNELGIAHLGELESFVAESQSENRAESIRNGGGSIPRHGLGLKVCVHLLNQIGGSLQARSSKGIGTPMIIRIPFSSIAERASEPSQNLAA